MPPNSISVPPYPVYFLANFCKKYVLTTTSPRALRICKHEFYFFFKVPKQYFVKCLLAVRWFSVRFSVLMLGKTYCLLDSFGCLWSFLTSHFTSLLKRKKWYTIFIFFWEVTFRNWYFFKREWYYFLKQNFFLYS